MSLWPEDFPNDLDKMGFLISLLTGSAVQWVTPLLTQPNLLLDDYAGFCHQLDAMFDDLVKAQMANWHLRELWQ